MPTNRPFLYNFFAAFRAHSVIQKASPSPTSAGSSSATASHSSTAAAAASSTTNTTASASIAVPGTTRTMATKATSPTTGATTAAVQAAGHLQSSRRQQSASPLSRSPGGLGSTPSPRRRSSSSSAEGFRDVLGGEKWYIGGRSAAGEERFYRLGVVRRQRSIDRLSLDRLSI